MGARSKYSADNRYKGRKQKINLLTLQDLRNLSEISLQNNPLTTLPGFAFAGMRNITNIYLGYNRLNKIDG